MIRPATSCRTYGGPRKQLSAQSILSHTRAVLTTPHLPETQLEAFPRRWGCVSAAPGGVALVFR